MIYIGMALRDLEISLGIPSDGIDLPADAIMEQVPPIPQYLPNPPVY